MVFAPWNEHENLVHLYELGVKFVTLDNLPDQESWYNGAFYNHNARRSSTASFQERNSTNSSAQLQVLHSWIAAKRAVRILIVSLNKGFTSCARLYIVL
ncbi:hypothetical protein KIN20_011552 [Parelaphostrongylus tenuis]|uniref:Uncharacterized protein n=1 Tax=Parelaphostrongylus tenuis TaxID=148309 RepID=A0AAD5MV77_PARTN|nr:hypothetical protein KIN20_011552 [Parelaphostrongylus tenuis]